MDSNLHDGRIKGISGAPVNNLPQVQPIFLGRETEILQIKQFLHEKGRVTLCGVDGVGKTRLAFQVAREISGQFGDGIFVVSLDSIVSPESITDATANILGLKINPRLDPLEQFYAELSSKNILLVLDGFEQNLEQTLFLTQLVERISSMKIIIISRERLRLENEVIMQIYGLPVPNLDALDAESYPSIQLFLQHARIFPNFEPDLASIAHICRMVDGMPLAIELASAWASTLSCAQIAHQIEQSLSLHPLDNVSGEYQSMIAIFDLIWELLSETEKRVLMGLSVFKGGFSHQAASKISGASSFFLDSALNKKFVQSNSPQRYALHSSLSQYLQQKLRANPILATDVEIRHGSHYLGILRDSEISFGQPDSISLMEDVLADVDNIRFAWKRTVAAGNLRLVQSAISAWMSILWNRGWFKEAIDSMELLTIRLSEFSKYDPEVVLIYVQTKKFLGEFYYLIGDNQSGLRELQNGLQRINESENSKDEPEMYSLPGNSQSAGERNRDSKEMYQLGLVLAEKVGDLSLVYKFINKLAVEAYMEADYQSAIPIAEHALEIARKLDDKSKIVQSLNILGNLYYAIKKYRRAKELLAEILAYPIDTKNRFLERPIFNTIGRVLTANEEYHDALQIFSQGLNLIKDANTDPWAVEILVSTLELLNSMKEKSIAMMLVKLLVDHPMASIGCKARATRLHETLTAEKVQPEHRDWSLDQMNHIVGDVMHILDQKGKS